MPQSEYSARVDHHRRRQQKAKSRHSSQVSSTRGNTNYAHAVPPENNSNLRVRTLSSSVVIQPRCPLMLGPEASPAASLDGHEYINFYVTRARSKRSFIIPTFKMSTVHSLDWAEFMANGPLYHAVAASARRIHERTVAPSKTVLKLRGKAIEEVRKHHSGVGENEQSVDPHAIAAVVMLAALDEQIGNAESYELHRKMIGILMACRGDISLDYNPIHFLISEAEVLGFSNRVVFRPQVLVARYYVAVHLGLETVSQRCTTVSQRLETVAQPHNVAQPL